MSEDFDSERLRRELKDPSVNVEGRWAPAFIYVCLALIIVFTLWANWALITEITRGQGTVIPSSRQQSIQSLEGGILDRLMVTEGQIVEAGEVLAHLNETRFKTAYEESAGQARALQATIARLEAEVTGESNITFSAEIEKESELARSEAKLFTARQARINAAQSAVRNEITATRAQLTVVAGLVKRKAAGKLEALKLKSQLAELDGRLTELRNTFVQEAYTELSLKKSELISLQQIIEQRLDQLTRTKLVSPVRGIVNDITISTQGGVIAPGDEIMQIIPLEDRLVFETRIRPEDIAFLAPNMEAAVKISAYDYTVYGGLKGKVERISTDTIIEKTPKGDESYYKVLVTTSQSYLEYGDKKFPIKPGMLADIDIQTGERSVLQYLLKPLKLLELR